MKILKSIGLYFVYPFLTFLLGIFTHIGYLKYFYPNKYLIQEDTYFIEESTYEVAKLDNDITTCNTDYVIVEYNVKEKTEVEKQDELPEKYWGMDRETLLESLEDYEKNPTLEDIEKGFVSVSLESFSGQEVRITKNYQPPVKTTGYYLMVLDGKIVVMEEDKKTIYLTTDIYAEALSDSLKQELIMGKFIHDMEELYGFLESYTS